jgi:hypothetical protein
MEVYKEFVSGQIRHTADIIKLSDVAQKAQVANGEAMFMSVYDFTKDYKDYAEEKKSIAGYDGSVSISKLFFDIDLGKGEEAITDEMCLNRARQLVVELQTRWGLEDKYIQPWFSGRGYHIITPDFFGFGIGDDVPTKVKATLTHYFKDIDPVVYDKTRLLRMGNSKHPISNLFKIPLRISELNDLNPIGIQGLAKEKRIHNDFIVDWSDYKPYYMDKIKTKVVIATQDPLALIHTPRTEFAPPSAFVTCCQKIFNQGPIKGNRHKTILVLASWLRRAGIAQELAGWMLVHWLRAEIADPNDRMTKSEVLRPANQVYEKPYHYWCNNLIMKEYCSDKCVYYNQRDDMSHFKDNAEVSAEFIDWYVGFNHDKSLDIGTFCGDNKPWWANPSELIVLSGDSGAGKSAFMQNLMMHSGLKTAYYQMEMGEELDRLRFNKMYFKKDDDELKEYFSSMSREELIESQKVFDNIYFKSASPNIHKIKSELSLINPELVVIDTMDMIQSRARNRLDQQREIVINLKKLAIEMDVIVVAIAHKTKSSSDTHSDFYNNDNNAIAGDGAIFQKADKILFVTTPHGQSGRERHIISSKNRNEGLLDQSMMFIGEKMLYKPTKEE